MISVINAGKALVILSTPAASIPSGAALRGGQPTLRVISTQGGWCLLRVPRSKIQG